LILSQKLLRNKLLKPKSTVIPSFLNNQKCDLYQGIAFFVSASPPSVFCFYSSSLHANLSKDMKTPSAQRYLAKGFTLIEILVVIAILAAIASVAYSAYFGSQQKAERTQCAANLNELKNLGTQFAADHYGILPCSGMEDDESTDNFDESKGWWIALAPYALTTYEEQPASATTPPELPPCFRCPADRRVARYGKTDYSPGTAENVSYTSWTDNSEDSDNPKSSIQTSRGQNLASIPWLSDGEAMPQKSIRKDSDFTAHVLPHAERHGNYICVLYADGRVKQIEEPTFKKVAKGLEQRKR
jgi:prepilin-type N-terminal cleavage/methylation domain-containing protein